MTSYDKVLGPAVVRGHLDTTPAVMSPSCPRTYPQNSRRSILQNPRTYDTGGGGFGHQRESCDPQRSAAGGGRRGAHRIAGNPLLPMLAGLADYSALGVAQCLPERPQV
jgi:hypothetical protein